MIFNNWRRHIDFIDT